MCNDEIVQYLNCKLSSLYTLIQLESRRYVKIRGEIVEKIIHRISLNLHDANFSLDFH